MIYILLIVIAIILDQVSKFIVQSNMDLGSSLPIIENFFHITYIHNYGAAFSIFQNQRILLVFIPLIMILAIFCFLVSVRNKSHPVLLLALSLIVAGGAGNLIDRIVRGYVVDFFDFRVFPVFNIADISVCCGCGLLILYLFFIEPKLNQKGVKEDE